MFESLEIIGTNYLFTFIIPFVGPYQIVKTEILRNKCIDFKKTVIKKSLYKKDILKVS